VLRDGEHPEIGFLRWGVKLEVREARRSLTKKVLYNIQYIVYELTAYTIYSNSDMQVPIGLDLIPDKGHESSNRFAAAQPGLVLSIESQLKLRALYDYLEVSRTTLDEIQTDLSMSESSPDASLNLLKASRRLKNFCLDADSWGFDAVYEIGLGLQMLLFDSGSRVQSDVFWETFNRGMAMLSALLDRCESDFRWRLAIADMLDCFKQLSHN